MSKTNQSKAIANIDDQEGQKHNIDRLASVKEEIRRLKTKAINLKREDKEKKKTELWMNLYFESEEKNDKLQALQNDLKYGEYFAKTDDIFPRNKYKLIEKSGFKGAADKTKRSSWIMDGYDCFIYQDIVNDLVRHLDPDNNDSVADLNTPSPSTASDYSTKSEKCTNASKIKAKDQVSKHASCGKAKRNLKENSDKKINDCIIRKKSPDGDPKEGTVGHKVYQVPKGGTSAPWWPFVCLWALGDVEQLSDFYQKIKNEENPAVRVKLVDKLLKALVQVATGTVGKTGGMRNNNRNLLYVPKPHDQYYDAWYNWVIIPIMTLEEMKNWDSGEYHVAIFVGERTEEITKSKDEKYNRFQDGPTKESAVVAEMDLFGGMSSEDIQICTTEDIEKVTDVLSHFLKAFADLHTRSCTDDGKPIDNIYNVHPCNWGIIDLQEAVKISIKEFTKKENKEEENGSATSTQEAKEDEEDNKVETTTMIFSESVKGVKEIIAQLLTESHNSKEDPGIRIPINPNTNIFHGKHVFKTHIRQLYSPDPILVAAKGTVNFGRQWGTNLMPTCTGESDSYSSCNIDDGSSNSTPLQSKDFTGLEIAVMTPDTLSPDSEVVIDKDDLNTDAYSDVSIGDFNRFDKDGAI